MPERNKILIIEDDFKSLKLQKGLLEHVGYEVFSAISAESGISLVKERLPDLIVMDHCLSGMNGEEALKLIRADEKTKNISVVFVTASVINEDKQRLESYHCKVITKPIDTRTFVQEIEEVLNGSR